MAARLIINADDFGLTPGVNRSIAELHRSGVLTSATLMATGAAFADAVSLANSLPNLGIGCHVVLTDGLPAAPPESIPTLLGPDRRSLRPSLLHFVRDLHLGRISEVEIAREAEAQIRKLQQAGITVTHVDTHKHTHLFPRVTRPLLHAMNSTGVTALRNPFEPAFARTMAHAGFKRRSQIALLNRFRSAFDRIASTAHTTGGTMGVSATGNLNAATLRQILAALPHEGTFELVCHPGYNDSDLDRIATRLRQHREIEHSALLAEIPQILLRPHPAHLIHYGNL